MESESHWKQWTVEVGKAALAFFGKHAFGIMAILLLIAMFPIFSSSLKEVQDLVEAEVVPKPLFDFIISTLGMCIALFALSLKSRR